MATAFESDVVRLTDFRANPDSMGRGKAIGMSVRSLRLQRNRTYALVSASGRGKSVFLSLLAGFPPFAWQNAMRWSAWEVFGKNILPPDGKRRNSFSPLFPIDGQNAIIYLPQTFPQDRAEDLPALEAMAFVLCVGGSAKSLAEARELVREVACAEPFVLSAKNLDQPLHQLSGGERRRLELATRLTAIYPRNNASPAASGRRALILLDEPTTGLDVLSETRFQLFLYELVEKAHSNGTEITTVVATHAFAHLA